MKIRNGFVSNSSSSSFVVYGVGINSNSFAEILVKKGIIKSIEEFNENYDEILSNKVNLEYAYESDDYLYLGLSPENANDDETFSNFKKRVAKKLKDIGVDKDPTWISEVISD
jgi:hypothetical protein